MLLNKNFGPKIKNMQLTSSTTIVGQFYSNLYTIFFVAPIYLNCRKQRPCPFLLLVSFNAARYFTLWTIHIHMNHINFCHVLNSTHFNPFTVSEKCQYISQYSFTRLSENGPHSLQNSIYIQLFIHAFLFLL